MTRLILCAALLLSGATIIGCEASGSVGADEPRGTEKSEKTVRDANGNVIEHEKTVEHHDTGY